MKNLIKPLLVIRYVSSSLIFLCLGLTFYACNCGSSGGGGDLLPGQIAITVTNPAKTLSPVEKSVTFQVSVRGLSGSDTIDVVDIDSADKTTYGLSLSDNTDIVAGENIITIQYNGTMAVTDINPITLDLIITDGESELAGDPKVVVKIADGQVIGRPIPVTQDNIKGFNTYANITGASGGLNKHYKLTEDVDWSLSGAAWTPIGRNGSTGSPNNFTGSFDGNGKKISKITINNTDYYIGMFAGIGASGEVKNLGLESVNISGGNNVGGVAGRSSGNIQNCYVIGTINGSSVVGGVVAEISNSGLVEKCYVRVDIGGNGSSVGGIVGQANLSAVVVRNCYAAGNVTGIGNNYGGIEGYNYGGSVEKCYSINNVKNSNGSGGYQYIGGVVGEHINSGTASNCVALNKTIQSDTGRTINIGRVSGTDSSNSTLINNYARLDMTINGYTPDAGADKKDGETITPTEYFDRTWWINTAKFDESVWNIENGKLPTLKGVGGAQNPVLP